VRKNTFEPGPGRADAHQLRELNQRVVLTAIAVNPGVSAAEIARITGLSSSATSRLVDALVSSNLVVEGDRISGKRGQPGIALTMNGQGAYSIGCQIGFGSSYAFLRSLGGQVLAEQEFDVERGDVSHIADKLVAAREQLLQFQPKAVRDGLVGMGIAVATDFDRLSRLVMGKRGAPEGWNERAFADLIRTKVDGDIWIYSTGSAGVWGELSVTQPPRPADYLYLYLDRFIQSGVLLNGQLWSGPHGQAGALGRVQTVTGKLLYELVGGHALAAHLIESQADYAGAVENWVGEVSEPLAAILSPVVHGLGLGLVILDGALDAPVLDQLVTTLDEALAAQSWTAPPFVRRGIGGRTAPAKGAASLPLYETFFAAETVRSI
jgi:predicted NBD/HSP70 family sugar kinase